MVTAGAPAPPVIDANSLSPAAGSWWITAILVTPAKYGTWNEKKPVAADSPVSILTNPGLKQKSGIEVLPAVKRRQCVPFGSESSAGSSVAKRMVGLSSAPLP